MNGNERIVHFCNGRTLSFTKEELESLYRSELDTVYRDDTPEASIRQEILFLSVKYDFSDKPEYLKKYTETHTFAFNERTEAYEGVYDLFTEDEEQMLTKGLFDMTDAFGKETVTDLFISSGEREER